MTKLELAICETENNSEIGQQKTIKNLLYINRTPFFTVLRYEFRRQ